MAHLRWGIEAFGLLLVTSFAAMHNLFGLSLRVDERFAVYWDGGRYAGNPLSVAKAAIGETPAYLRLGNFRPIGRMLDYFEHSVAYQMSVASRVPVNVVHGLFRFAAAALLGVAALGLARQYLPSKSRTGRNFQYLFVVAFAAHVILAGPAGPPLIYPWLYMITPAAGLALAWYVGRFARPASTLNVTAVILLVLAGAAIAATNEVATIGIGIALAHALLLTWVHKLKPWNPTIQAWLIAAGGFLSVFVPVRILIARACATATCYMASDLGLSTWTPRVFFSRFASGVLPVTWHRILAPLTVGNVVDYLIGYGGLVVVVGLALVVAAWAGRSGRFGEETPADANSGNRALMALIVLGITIAAGAALMASLSKGVQQANIPTGFHWRESGLAFAGWGIILTAAALMAANAARGRFRRILIYVSFVVFALALLTTSYLNDVRAQRYNAQSEAIINNQIAASLTNFAKTDFGNEYRCSLLKTWEMVYRDKHLEARPARLANSLNLAAKRTYHRNYCAEE